MAKKLHLVLGFGVLAPILGAAALWALLPNEPTSPVSSSSLPATPRVAVPLQVAELIYDGKFANGWEDWGWGRHELPEKTGPAKVVFGGYGGIILHRFDESSAPFGGFSFRYKAPRAWPEFLAVSVKRSGSSDTAFPQVVVQPKDVALLADGWREVFLDWSLLDPSNLPIERITISARSTVGSEPVLLDKIELTKPSATARVAVAPIRDVQLGVLCEGKSQPISPLIYGATAGDPSSGQSAARIGGNPTTRFNWDAGNLWNTGSDWFFENGTSEGTVWEWIDGAAAIGIETALTVPMIGWVSKDATSVGFPWSKISAQRKRDPNRPEAGDGFHPDGSEATPGPPSETSVAAPPEVIGRWIRAVRDKDRIRGKRGVQMYLLDNEPSLWNRTHRDVHPLPVTYDELLDRTIRYGSEIRKADPEAVIAGPTEWGWSAYFYSAKDRDAGIAAQPDRRMHEGIPLIPWYLQQLAAYEKAKNTRLLDVLDVHFYPAADGVFGSGARTDAEGSALRLRSTRALWDPSYRDESWIKESIRLIPRLKQWVAENYPGRKVSIGEWSFGADKHISGGLATAEALGRFGQQGLDAAFFYGGPKPGTPVFWAFRAYRNFDGKGGRFQDVSLPTREADKVSLFASRDDSGKHLVLVLVNTDPVFAIRGSIDLTRCGKASSRRVFEYGPQSTTLLQRASEVSTAAPVTLAPYSFAVIDLEVQRDADAEP